MEFLEIIAKYLILPLLSVICTLGWKMHNKLGERLDALESRTNNTEKEVIEIRTEIRKDIQYLAQDVKEIKELLQKK